MKGAPLPSTRRVCSARGDWQPRGAAAPAPSNPRRRPPPPRLGRARESGSGPRMRSKPWQWECDPTWKGAHCFASAFFFFSSFSL